VSCSPQVLIQCLILLGWLLSSPLLKAASPCFDPHIQWEIKKQQGALHNPLIHPTSDGGFYAFLSSPSSVGLDTNAYGWGGIDIKTERYRSDGTLVWEKNYGGASDDFLTSFVETRDEGFVLAGSSNSGVEGNKTSAFFGGDSDAWIVKIDKHGNKKWEVGIGGTNADWISFIKETSDGGFICVGTSYSPPSGNKKSPLRATDAWTYLGDVWVVRIDKHGKVLWEQSFGGVRGASPVEALLLPNDGVAILSYFLSPVGSLPSNTADLTYLNGSDFWLLRLDQDGRIVGDQLFGGRDQIFPTSCSPAPTAVS
jgi:hypothetical protein